MSQLGPLRWPLRGLNLGVPLSRATAELLGQQPTVFPSHHGGFLGGESGYAGQLEAFARRLREVLDDDN